MTLCLLYGCVACDLTILVLCLITYFDVESMNQLGPDMCDSLNYFLANILTMSTLCGYPVFIATKIVEYSPVWNSCPLTIYFYQKSVPKNSYCNPAPAFIYSKPRGLCPNQAQNC